MPYAKIVNGLVASLHDTVPTLPPKSSALFVECADGTQVGWLWLPTGCVAPPEPGPNAALDAQILALEATVTQRRLREAALTEAGKAWLADVDAQIVALRAQRV